MFDEMHRICRGTAVREFFSVGNDALASDRQASTPHQIDKRAPRIRSASAYAASDRQVRTRNTRLEVAVFKNVKAVNVGAMPLHPYVDWEVIKMQ